MMSDILEKVETLIKSEMLANVVDGKFRPFKSVTVASEQELYDLSRRDRLPACFIAPAGEDYNVGPAANTQTVDYSLNIYLFWKEVKLSDARKRDTGIFGASERLRLVLAGDKQLSDTARGMQIISSTDLNLSGKMMQNIVRRIEVAYISDFELWCGADNSQQSFDPRSNQYF